MSINIDKINKDKVGFFRFKKLNNFYLLTNEVFYIKLLEADFQNFLNGTLDEESDLYKELASKGFVKDKIDIKNLTRLYRVKNNFLLKKGVSLHIIIITKRCNHLCVYCQAGSPELQQDIYDMKEDVAQKTVDLIFQSPNNYITIEFQGGEPLINFKTIKFTIEYALEKNKQAKKDLNFSLVTNLSLMTDEMYDYLVESKVNLCTSLDGPKHVHDKNRPFLNPVGSYEIVSGWIEKMKKREAEGPIKKIGALPTLTRYSLEHIEEVIDEYIKYNLKTIHLRQLSFLGNSFGEKKREEFGYSPEEFISAWKRGMDYILEKNKQGIDIRERGVIIMLEKIFKEQGNAFLDLRSPCGAGTGQLAYFYNGDVYSCDEGRMTGNDLFLLGNVFDNTYEEITECPKEKALITASTLENFSCDECVYKPYCGTCPVLNYTLYNNLFPNIKMTDRCKLHTAMLDYIFLKMEDREVLEIFKKWIR